MKNAAQQRLAGVAHDFNHLLQIMLGNAQLLEWRMSEDSAARAEAREIASACQRAAQLARQIIASCDARPVAQRSVLDLRSPVRRLEHVLGRLLREDVQLRIDVGNAPCLARIDAQETERILLNLALNAQDAMPGGGALVIETRRRANHVELRVRDTGRGMDESTRARVFEPFFTTREAQGGTGLGLTSVLDIVEQCGGSVDVASEIGAGTTFTVRLPLQEHAGPSVLASPAYS